MLLCDYPPTHSIMDLQIKYFWTNAQIATEKVFILIANQND